MNDNKCSLFDLIFPYLRVEVVPTEQNTVFHLDTHISSPLNHHVMGIKYFKTEHSLVTLSLSPSQRFT